MRAVREAHVLQRVHEEGRVVIQSGDGHLQTHSPQFTALHTTGQTLQHHLYEERDTLKRGRRGEEGGWGDGC